MYKSDIYAGLKRLEIAPGGQVAGLLEAARLAQPGLQLALGQVASGKEELVKSSPSRVIEAVRGLTQRLVDLSFFGTVVELHGLAQRFDAVLDDHPELESLLRPGRQALADLSSAFDDATRNVRRTQSIVGLVAPALELDQNLRQYAVLMKMFSVANAESVDDWSGAATLEFDGRGDLEGFADFILIIASIARSAGIAILESPDAVLIGERVSVSAIESGSPIKITLLGGNGTIKLMLAMLRDMGRIAYQNFTVHGKVHQTMETFARAREMGIDSPAALDQLQQAVVTAARAYATTVDLKGPALSVDGKPLDQAHSNDHTGARMITYDAGRHDEAREAQKQLNSPASDDSATSE